MYFFVKGKGLVIYMLKNSYALDLDYNCYVLNPGFENYRFPETEINYVLENKCLRETEDTGKIILYGYRFLYLATRDFIEKFKLSREEKILLLNDIANIKIKDITSENIKEISFLLHYAPFIAADYEDAEVVAYQAPMNVLYQRFPFSQRMFYFTEEAQFRKDDAVRTEKELKEKISFNTQDKVSFSDEASGILKEDKSLGSLYNGLSDLELNDAGQNKSENKFVSKRTEVAFWGCSEEPKYEQYPDVDTDGDGKADVNVGDMATKALYLVEKEQKVNTDLSKWAPRSKGFVCIDVPWAAYQWTQIDMEGKMVKAAKNNPDGYTIGTDSSGKTLSPEEDKENIVRRVQNWKQFFSEKGLYHDHNKLEKEGKTIPPYQVADVLFISHDGTSEPDHSAIVTKIDPYTGIPTEIVAASFKEGKVIKYGSWEEWNNYLDDTGGTLVGHAGFRPPE